jgi:hypothetical protein
MVQVDPGWLHDPHRVFPVNVDVPIVTGSAGADTTWASTVTSCASDLPASQTVVVGQEGSCSYHGLLYFDVSSLPWNATIASATLHLYTPATTAATGIQVHANSPVPLATAYEQPTWDDAPALQSGETPVPESATDTRWVPESCRSTSHWSRRSWR